MYKKANFKIKKFMVVFLAFSIFFQAIPFINGGIVRAAVQAIYFIDPVNGNDNNNGSSTSIAFKTVTKARDVVRTVNTSMTGDIMVYIMPGTCAITSTVQFNQSDSGTNGYNINYKAYDMQNKPVISGGKTITDWTLYDANKNIYKATPGETIATRQLFVNGKRAVRARSNGGLSNATYDSNGHTTTDTFLSGYVNKSDIEMVYKSKYANSRCGVSSITTTGSTATITMKQPGWRYCRNKYSTSVTTPIYYENAYELLDEEGEWYLDTTGEINGTAYTFYYKPKSGENMSTANVIAPVLEELVTVKGSTIDTPVHNIQFIGIQFQYATWLRPSGDRGHPDVQSNIIEENETDDSWVDYIPGAAVELKTAKSIVFERCDFSKLGSTALNIIYGSQDDIVRGCTITDISGIGIQVGEMYMNDVNTYNPSDNKYKVKNIDIFNNYISDIGVEFTSAVGINAGYPEDLCIVHNEICNTRYSGITVGWGWNDFRETGTANKLNHINYNYLHDTMILHTDGASIYTLGTTGNSAGSKGEVIGNYIKDGGNNTGGIYFDQCSNYYDMLNNVIENVETWILCNNYSDHITINNTYTTSLYDYINPTSTNISISNTKYVTNGNDWPQAAQDIIENAGIQPEYRDIIPDINDGFNQVSTGGSPPYWSLKTTGGTVTVENVPDISDKSVKLYKSGTANDCYATKLFSKISGKAVVEARFRTDHTGYMFLPNVLDCYGNAAISIIAQSGYINYKDGSGGINQIASISTGVWYDLRIVLDTDTDKMDIYLNGILVAYNIAFRTAVSSISAVELGFGSSVSGTSYFDNIRIFPLKGNNNSNTGDKVFVYDNFNSSTTGTQPYGYTCDTSGGTVAIQDQPSTSDKSVKITKVGTIGSSTTAVRNVNNLSGEITVQYKFMAPNVSHTICAPYIYDSNDRVAVSILVDNGVLKVKNADLSLTNLVNISSNTWYTVKVVLNTDTDKYSVYVNGDKVLNQANFRQTVSHVSKVQFETNMVNNASIYFDNLKVFKMDYNNTYFIEEDFNGQTSGNQPQGWVKTGTGGTFTIGTNDSVIDFNCGKVTRDGTQNDLSAYRYFGARSGIITVETAIYYNDSAYKCAPYIYDSSDMNNPVISIAMVDGYIKVKNSDGSLTNVQATVVNTWYDLKVVLDTNTYKFNVYVDGVKRLTMQNFRNNKSSIGAVGFEIGSTVTNNTLYFDDVKVYKSGWVNDDFSYDTIGQSPLNYDIVTTGGTVTVGEPTKAFYKGMVLTKTGDTGVVESGRTFDSKSGIVTITQKVSFGFSGGTSAAKDFNFLVYDTSGNEAIGIYVLHDGWVMLYNYKNSSNNNIFFKEAGHGPFLARFKLVINTDTDKFDVYVDDVLCLKQAPLKNNVSNICRINYKIPSGTGQDKALMNVDDVMVY